MALISITGVVTEISKIQQRSNIITRELVLEEINGRRSSKFKLQAINDNTALLDKFKIHDQVIVECEAYGVFRNNIYYHNYEIKNIK
jgi:predicted RNA-binding protein